MDIIGIDHNNKSFFVAFAFLPDQTESSYFWALVQIRTLYSLIHPTIGLLPGSISTDCDQVSDIVLDHLILILIILGPS